MYTVIAFIQPFGLNSTGGGSRILRSLLTDAPHKWFSVCTSPHSPPRPCGDMVEYHLPVRPCFGRLERTRYGNLLSGTTPFFQRSFSTNLEGLLRRNACKAVHAIPHGIEYWLGFQVARQMKLPYILNVHDEMEHTLRGRPDKSVCTGKLPIVWSKADERVVISEAMGLEYCRRYGARPFTVITDGISSFRTSARPRQSSQFRVYFAGLVAHSYEQNFRAFFGALAALDGATRGLKISFTCRGGLIPWKDVPFSKVDILPWSSAPEIDQDLEKADFLYLPLPFEARFRALSRFSLSTKMITYLGSGLPIIFHGPPDSAAGELLARHGAAITIDTLDPQAIARRLTHDSPGASRIVGKALELSRKRFCIDQIRARFWQIIDRCAQRPPESALGW